jgi:hypothetical protein
LSKDAASIAEILKGQGYRTVLYTDYPHLFGPNDLDRGFELTPSRFENWLYRLLDKNKEENVFLFAHFFDDHEPFLHNTNEYEEGVNDDYMDELELLYQQFPEAGTFSRNGNQIGLWNNLIRGPLKKRPIEVFMPLFVKGITKFDRGRFRNFMGTLEETGFLNDALTVICSDHGEGRTHPENIMFAHSGDVYDNVLRVPLMIRHPDLAPGVRDDLVSTVDIVPTVLSLLGIEPGPGLDGVDLQSERRDAAYAETWTHGSDPVLVQTAVRTVSEKFIVRNHRGKVDELETGASFSLDNEEFVKKTYQDILGREADDSEVTSYVNVLNKKTMTKASMLQHFLNSGEYLAAPRHAYYDLIKDPLEDQPLDPAGHPDWPQHLELIESISSATNEAENVFTE